MTRIVPLNQLLVNVPSPGSPTPAPAEAASAPALPQDGLKVSGSQSAGQLPGQNVQLAPQAAQLSPSEIRRLLSGPNSLNKVQTLIERQPELKHNFKKPGSPEVLNLLKTASQRPLNATEIRTLQKYLVQQEKLNISYKGNPTGIDGDYGKLTHKALLQVLTSSATPAAPQPAAEPAVLPSQPGPQPETATQPAPAQTAPVEVEPASLLRQLSSAQSLGQLAQQLQSLPESERAKFTQLAKNGQNLGALLQKAAQGPLSKSETQALQSLLVEAGQSLKYPGHATGIDGDFGKRSRQALINVASQLIHGQELKPAQPAAPAAKEPAPEYQRMLEDNLLDMTLAIGYDEGTAHYASANLSEEIKVEAELGKRGFVKNEARARELLKEAGLESSGHYAALYVKEGVAEHNGKPVHAIVRLIKAGDGSQGAANRQAAIEGMNQSDLFAYGGHGRYGNGPDFDRNFTVTVDWNGVENAPASGTVVYQDYEELKQLLGGSDDKAIRRLQELEKSGKLTIQKFNDGNIRMNEKLQHSYEFGAQLTERAVRGVANTLSEEIDTKRYKLWLFEACRTKDYVKPLAQEAKANPNLNSSQLDLITTEQMMYWENTGASLLALMDGVMAQENNQGLMQRLRAANPEQALAGQTHSMHNFQDNQ